MTQHGANLQFGDLVLDLERQRVSRDGGPIDLPGLSFRLLEVLVRNAGQPVSRKELRHQVWGEIVVSDEALRQRVKMLRQDLGSADYVATVKGVGYRAAKPVTKIPLPEGRRRPWLIAAMVAVALVTLALLGLEATLDLKHAIVHALRH